MRWSRIIIIVIAAWAGTMYYRYHALVAMFMGVAQEQDSGDYQSTYFGGGSSNFSGGIGGVGGAGISGSGGFSSHSAAEPEQPQQAPPQSSPPPQQYNGKATRGMHKIH